MGANQQLFDASTRHAIGVRRFSGGEVKEILRILEESDIAIQQRILRTKGAFTKRRLRALRRDLRKLRSEVFKKIHNSSRASMIEFAGAEQEFTKGLLNSVLPIEFEYAVAEARTLRALVTQKPFSGGTNAANDLRGWWRGVEAADQQRIQNAINLGVAQAETIPQITSRAMSAMELTRRNAEAVVRTAVNHVSNASREEFFKENSDVVEVLMWASTLDGRTTAICRARDGHYTSNAGVQNAKVPSPHLQPPEARPPAHVQCRSYMAGMLNTNGIADKMPDRPAVRDTRTRRQREIDFRAEAKHNAKGRWKTMSRSERNHAIRVRKQKWTRNMVGTVPGKLNYDTWLRKQPVKFQNEVLGVRKGKAFRKGLRLDKFVDRRGSELTLVQLRERFPDFIAGA